MQYFMSNVWIVHAVHRGAARSLPFCRYFKNTENRAVENGNGCQPLCLQCRVHSALLASQSVHVCCVHSAVVVSCSAYGVVCRVLCLPAALLTVSCAQCCSCRLFCLRCCVHSAVVASRSVNGVVCLSI